MIRLFLFFNGASFIVAGLIYRGVLVDGYQDAGAAVAETVIGVVLLAAFGLTWVWPARTRPIGVAAQAFALVGTLIGASLSVIGVGPHTVPDFVNHISFLVALTWGLVVAARAPADGARRRGERERREMQ